GDAVASFFPFQTTYYLNGQCSAAAGRSAVAALAYHRRRGALKGKRVGAGRRPGGNETRPLCRATAVSKPLRASPFNAFRTLSSWCEGTAEWARRPWATSKPCCPFATSPLACRTIGEFKAI